MITIESRPVVSSPNMDTDIPRVLAKVESIVNHIKNVQRNTYKLGVKLIQRGERKIGIELIANGQIHDNSKLHGIEFEHLFYGDSIFEDVRLHHATENKHHPEHWGNIHDMPEVYVAEMICDWHARSSEFGTDLKQFIREKATVRFGFTQEDKIYKTMERFTQLLLDPAFTYEPQSQLSDSNRRV